jgi:hypothetical protein
MDLAERSTTRGGVLQKIFLTLFPLGTLLYALLRGLDADLHLIIGVASGFLVYIVTFIDLTLGLAILIACVGLSPELTIGGIQDFRLEDFVVPALLLSWFTKAMERRIPLAQTLVMPALPLYGAAIVLSTLLGVAAGTTSLTKAILYMGKFTEFFLIYLLLVNNVLRREEFRALAIFSILVSLSSALMTANSFADDSSAGRLNGPLGETANMYGCYLILNLAIAVGLFLHAPTSGGRTAAAAAVVLLGIPLLYTYSRTSFVALAGATLIFGAVKDRRLLMVSLIVGLLLPVVAPDSIMERISTLRGMTTGESPSSWLSRVAAWGMEGGRTMDKSPLFGFGLASVPLGQVDNEYVRVFVDTGVLGLGLFLWVLAGLGRRANALVSFFDPHTFERGYASGYCIAFIAMAIHAVGATSYTSIRTMECFILATGLFATLHNHREEWGERQVVTPGGGTILLTSAPVLDPQGPLPVHGPLSSRSL